MPSKSKAASPPPPPPPPVSTFIRTRTTIENVDALTMWLARPIKSIPAEPDLNLILRALADDLALGWRAALGDRRALAHKLFEGEAEAFDWGVAVGQFITA